MDAFLSEAITDKESIDEIGDRLNYGASSVQGWRVNQEDSHNCIMEYDENTSLFAVYDGHSGQEVAQYCSEKLPEFIKNTEAYKQGNIEKALIDGFLGFDASLKTCEVMEYLQELKEKFRMGKKGKTRFDDDDDDNEQEEGTNDVNEKEGANGDNKEDGTDDGDKEEGTDNHNRGEGANNDGKKEDGNDDAKVEGTNINNREEGVNGDAKDEGTNDSDKEECANVDDKEEGDNDHDDDDDDEEDLSREPGYLSGCTAIVAILKGNELFVANAGDSRCVISRNGKAVEMSVDHKPEDEPERQRVIKAGGEVTSEGRVNNGLNLSRAIGDHNYKQNEELSDKEQMITALPDVKRLIVNPKEDEFMVLACDGIWNPMTSEEVVDFVRPKMKENKKLSEICEEMFDYCIAPEFESDCKGFDNMTAIIIKFK